jgi:putrescine aminotransferase
VTVRAAGQRQAFISHPAARKYAQHVNPAFVDLLGVLGYGRVFTCAHDVWVRDDTGERYLDLLAGFGAAGLGHNHPRLAARVRALLADEPLNLCHVGPSPHAADLAEMLAVRLGEPFAISLFASGGGEAVEAAMKLARAATRRTGFAFCAGGYHGTNFGTLSLMSVARWRQPFEPLLADCVSVPFGDIDALERELARKQAAAFIVEPIQAEGGVRMPPPDYLHAAKALCERFGTLLVFDEIQTGLGRTGTWFAFQGARAIPDIIVLGKALGGGLTPISAAVTSRELHARAYGSKDRFDLHSSTFAGNTLACVSALETLQILADEHLVENSAARGEQLLTALRAQLAGHPLIVDIRGRGLLVGIEIGPTDSGLINRLAPGLVSTLSEKVIGQWLALKLLERGVICQPSAHAWNVLRLAPPLTIQPAEIEQAVSTVAAVFDEYRSLPKLIGELSARVLDQATLKWRPQS